MVTIKSHTSLEQSKKLAEILPLESADCCWGIDDETLHYNNSPYPCAWKDYTCKEYYIPCWSLAALLGVLPDSTDIVKDKTDTENEKYMCTVGVKDDIISTFGNNPVDTCYEMILKLNELKML